MEKMNVNLDNYEKVTYNDDEVMEMIKKVNAYIIDNLRNESLKDTFNDISGSIGGRILVDFSNAVASYEIRKGYLEDEMRFYAWKGLTYDPNGNSYEQKEYRKAKDKIIAWYNCIK